MLGFYTHSYMGIVNPTVFNCYQAFECTWIPVFILPDGRTENLQSDGQNVSNFLYLLSFIRASGLLSRSLLCVRLVLYLYIRPERTNVALSCTRYALHIPFETPARTSIHLI